MNPMAPKAQQLTSESSFFDNRTNDDERIMARKDGFYYLTPDAREKLPQYQYRGADYSLLYRFVLSPLAGFCIENLVPKTVAPNSITLFGLFLMLIAYLIYWYFVPSMDIEEQEEHPPQWIFLWNGMAMLLYQTLDNMDGKQARRTHSSSPLGLLFDHGCDAINSIFGSVNWIIGMALVPRDNLLECWLLIFGPYALFYISTWEQYHTGELILPIMNGPNEGLLGGALLSFTSWMFGPSYWQRFDWFESLQSVLSFVPSSWKIRNCDFVILASTIGFVQEIGIKTVFVTRKKKDIGVLTSLFPMFCLAGCFLWLGVLDPSLWLVLPRTGAHLSMLLFVEMCTELMLAHITSQPFSTLGRWHVYPLLALTLWMTFLHPYGEEEERPTWVAHALISYTGALAAYLSFKISLVIYEICETLQINCFDIVTPRHPMRSHDKKVH